MIAERLDDPRSIEVSDVARGEQLSVEASESALVVLLGSNLVDDRDLSVCRVGW